VHTAAVVLTRPLTLLPYLLISCTAECQAWWGEWQTATVAHSCTAYLSSMYSKLVSLAQLLATSWTACELRAQCTRLCWCKKIRASATWQRTSHVDTASSISIYTQTHTAIWQKTSHVDTASNISIYTQTHTVTWQRTSHVDTASNISIYTHSDLTKDLTRWHSIQHLHLHTDTHKQLTAIT